MANPGSDTHPTADERSNAMLCHLLAFAAMIFPLGNIFGPLIIWLAQKGKSEFIDRHGRESLNFQITMTLLSAVITVALLWPIARAILAAWQNGASVSREELIPGGEEGVLAWFLIGAVALALLSLFDVVMTIVGAVKANSGQTFRYPLTLRLF